MAPPSAAGIKRQLRSSWVPQRLWIWECTGTGVSGMAVHRSCACRGLHTWSCTCSSAELPACGTNNAVIGTAAALWPINAPSHTAHPPQIASEHLSETLSKRTGKGNHRSHAKSLEYWIYSLLPALNESSNHNGFWTPSLPTRMQKIKQYFLIHKALNLIYLPDLNNLTFYNYRVKLFPPYQLTNVMMSFAKSLARSGVTKQDKPVSATPVSYWLGLLRS